MSPGGTIGSEILVKIWDMDTWEHLEMKLEVVLWICFSRRTLFLVFEEKIFFQLFSMIFFHRQTFSSSFQKISLFRVLWITWNNHRNPVGLFIFENGGNFFRESPKNISNFFEKQKFYFGPKASWVHWNCRSKTP